MVWRRRLLRLWAVFSALWIAFALWIVIETRQIVDRELAKEAGYDACHHMHPDSFQCPWVLDAPQRPSLEYDAGFLILPPLILLFLGVAVSVVVDGVQRQFSRAD